MPTAEWGFRPGYLSLSKYPKVKGDSPTRQVLDWIATCESYMQHDPEADISRPLCMKVLCVKAEGHKGSCVKPCP